MARVSNLGMGGPFLGGIKRGYCSRFFYNEIVIKNLVYVICWFLGLGGGVL